MNIKRIIIIGIILSGVVVLVSLYDVAGWATDSPNYDNTTFDNVTTNWNNDGYVTNIGQYSDEFNSGSLDTANWWWVRENSGAWIMGDTYIQINSTDTDMYQGTHTAPILLHNISTEYLYIMTNMTATPDSAYEGGGLVFYADDDNFVMLMYYYDAGDTKIIMKKEDNNVQVYTKTGAVGAGPIYLKLYRQGTNYLGYYSNNSKVSWTYVQTYAISDTMTDAGILAYGAGSADPEPFNFDYFITDNFTRDGNFTVYYDAGEGYRVKGYDITLTTPPNANVTTTYKNNETSEQRILGTNQEDDAGHIAFDVTGTLFQKADLIITLHGGSNTPIIESVEVFTEIADIDDPSGLANTTGVYWANFTWNESVDANLWQVMIDEE